VRAELENVLPGAFEGHPAEAALLLNVVGSLEHARNRDDNAVLYYGQALKLLRTAHGPVSADAAQVESNLGFLRLEMGQYTAAKDCFRRSIQEIESTLGTNHAALIPPLVNLARCENLTRSSGQAEVVARRAVTISTEVLGEAHPVTAAAMFEQATALHQLGRKKEARELEKQANMSLRRASAASLCRYTVGFRQLSERTRNRTQPYSRTASGR
jgi:tetratricopeptide (TPR) repeat protein